MFKRYVYQEGLTNLLGSNGSFKIDIFGEIVDAAGRSVDRSIDSDRNVIVKCTAWNGFQEYRVIDLVAIQFKSLSIPKEEYGKLIAFTIDGNPENTHAKNIGYRFAGGKLEVKDMVGFYYVPGMTSVAVNRAGCVVNVSSKNQLKLYTTKKSKNKNTKGGYKTFSGLFTTGKTVNFLRHRALCLVFKDYPDNVDDMTVNHKNGTPGDDRLDNLEWVTKRENNIHAYINNLKNQQKRVLVRDVVTGLVREFYSISECSRALCLEVGTILSRLNRSEFGTVFYDGTQIKLADDTRDWVIPKDALAAMRDAKLYRGVKVRDCRTLAVMFFESVKEAGVVTGIKPGTIVYRLIARDASPLFGYQFLDSDSSREFPTFTENEFNKSLVPNEFSVSARNLITGEEFEFASVRKAECKINQRGISKYLRDGVQPVYETGWNFKYSEEPWVEIDDVDRVLYELRSTVMAKNEMDGQIHIAESSQRMSEILKLDPKAIRKAALSRGNIVYRNYRFRLGVSSEEWPSGV